MGQIAWMKKLVLENKAVTVCPELMGGFSTPREPAEIVGCSQQKSKGARKVWT